jgi:RTX calcium-binding nonapeptide repeat (4 copies)
MIRIALALALAGLALTASPASALTTVSYAPGTGLSVVGDDVGEAVQVNVEPNVPRALIASVLPADRVPFNGTPGAVFAAGANCTLEPDPVAPAQSRVRCPLPDPMAQGDLDVTANVGGGNDTFGAGTLVSGSPSLFVPTATGVYDGGPGDDLINGVLQTQTIRGGDGIDSLAGFDGNDRLEGGPGLLNGENGGAGNDVIIGGPGIDEQTGGPGDDRMEGGGGNDTFSPGPGKNVVLGQDGNDSLASGGPIGSRIADTSGSDTYSGGDGSDFLGYADRTLPITLGADGRGGQTGESDAISPDVEKIEGGRGNDKLMLVLKGAQLPATLKGGPGTDRLEAQVPAVATLDGGSDGDKLVGSKGAEIIKARDGVKDDITCGDGSDTLDADLTDSPPTDCESVTQGATREGSNVAIRTARAKVRRDGTLPVRLSCPKSLGKLGCTGTLRVGSGPAKAYAIRAGKASTVRPALAARDASLVARRGRVLRAMSVERGRFGPKTTIRAIEAE